MTQYSAPDDEVSVLEFWGKWITPWFPLFPGSLSPLVAVLVRLPSMDQIELYKILLK